MTRTADEEIVLDDRIELPSDGREEREISAVLGRYEIRARDDCGVETTVESRIGEHFQFDSLSVSDDGVRIVESTADVAPCEW